jgi:hypothetical protein
MTSCINHPFEPQLSEFCFEKEKAYSLWLQAQIDKRLIDNKQTIPHDQVMARMDAVLGKLTKTSVL